MEGIKPLMASKERQKQDPIFSEGLKIRRRSIALFLASLLLFFAVLRFDGPIIDFPIAAFMICAYAYSRKFRSWELANKDYLRKMGFCVNE